MARALEALRLACKEVTSGVDSVLVTLLYA